MENSGTSSKNLRQAFLVVVAMAILSVSAQLLTPRPKELTTPTVAVQQVAWPVARTIRPAKVAEYVVVPQPPVKDGASGTHSAS
jgi:hypothetical protein